MISSVSEIRSKVNCDIAHHASLRTVQDHIESLGYKIDDFKIFTTVRNPWDRAVSIYHYGLKNPKSVWNKAAVEAGAFNNFLNSSILARHFRPDPGQTPVAQGTYDIDTFCQAKDGSVPVTVFRMEELDMLPPWLEQNFNLERSLPHVNETERRAYRNYYDEESRARVAWLFENDIRRFGYIF